MTLRPKFALREAHAHVFQHGRSLGMADLSKCRTADEAIEALAEHAAGHEQVLAHGARPESWDPPRWPTLDQLDSVAGSKRLVMLCFDYHALAANRPTLTAAGITERSVHPPGGLIGRDHEGRLTGVVYEQAALRVWESLPEPTPAEAEAMVSAAVEDLAMTHGFSELHDLKSQPWLGPMLGRIPARTNARFKLWPLLKDLPTALASRSSWESERVQLGGAKIFVDGTLNSRTAWMLHPYADGRATHPCGTPMMTSRQIEDAVEQCDRAGVPLAAHAIGDAAVRAVLNAIEKLQPRTRGFRIEHCELIDEADVPRFAELGVIASVQPCHLLYDIEALARGVSDRLERVLPLRALIEAGLEPGRSLIFGSDVPIVRANPEDSVLAATKRTRAGEPTAMVIGPEHALTEAEAWRCFATD